MIWLLSFKDAKGPHFLDFFKNQIQTVRDANAPECYGEFESTLPKFDGHVLARFEEVADREGW